MGYEKRRAMRVLTARGIRSRRRPAAPARTALVVLSGRLVTWVEMAMGTNEDTFSQIAVLRRMDGMAGILSVER